MNHSESNGKFLLKKRVLACITIHVAVAKPVLTSQSKQTKEVKLVKRLNQWVVFCKCLGLALIVLFVVQINNQLQVH